MQNKKQKLHKQMKKKKHRDKVKRWNEYNKSKWSGKTNWDNPIREKIKNGKKEAISC